ncbi:SRPBCC family protein [Halapricum sp. CBA1109]|uniref:SRPBCC family protein n=1 Tax=Halapricum sp. CBA1109 TaxID=2668068 RepID=UPI0012F9C4CE|nr:SRPBCC family protein [Halapricum sp. CBA1109]MUV89509.1 SRPBCC family protein [Halapricum sp. CBA1109]
METIELTHTVDASRESVASAVDDLEPFMRAAGFDEVTLDGDELTIAKAVGLLRISLDLELFDEADTVLAYRQVDGIFEDMETRYWLENGDDGTTVRVETIFGLDAPGGSLLDATVIKRQRTKEIAGQFDYLDERVA